MVESYDGTEPLVPDNSYLRALPQIVARKQRLLMDGWVVSGDMMTFAYQNLQRIAKQIGPDVNKVGSLESAAMTGSAWTIIDQLHASRMIERAFLADGSTDEVGPKTQAFLDQTEIAHKMRGQFRHLHTNIDNMANRKGRQNPLFGALSYIYAESADKAFILSIAPGSVHENSRLPAVNPAGLTIRSPVDHFHFTAFGETIDLGKALYAFKEYIAAQSEKIESQLKVSLARIAQEKGLTVEQVSQQMGATMAISLEVQFKQEEGKTETVGKVTPEAD